MAVTPRSPSTPAGSSLIQIVKQPWGQINSHPPGHCGEARPFAVPARIPERFRTITIRGGEYPLSLLFIDATSGRAGSTPLPALCICGSCGNEYLRCKRNPAAASMEIYRAVLFETRFQLKLSIGLIGVLILSKEWKRFQANPAVYWSLGAGEKRRHSGSGRCPHQRRTR